jgi:hypothetical protein
MGKRSGKPAGQLVTPREAARIFGLISSGSVRAMEARGELAALRTLSGRRLFLLGDVMRLKAERAKAARAKAGAKKNG